MKIQIDKATVEQAIEAIRLWGNSPDGLTVQEELSVANTLEMLKAALTAAPAEPVAWGMERNGEIYDVICSGEHDRCEGEYTIPLYRAPQPQREPLTNGEIYTAYIEATNQTLRPQDERLALAFARAIEKALK